MATEEGANKREDFRKYINDSGILEALTQVLISLYELEIKPIDPLDYIRTHMTETVYEREELKMMKTKHHDMITEIRTIEEENMKLAKMIKGLENYNDELSDSKIASDEDCPIETEE